MKSNVSVEGHPIHPIIVSIAIGAFVSAFIFDIGAFATNSPTWFDMSFWTLFIGVFAGIFAALTGLYDYVTLHMSSDARKDATIHLLLNVIMMVLFILSLLLKREYAGAAFLPYGRIASTFFLDLVGIACLVASGWYGGEIVYRHGVAVVEDAASELRGVAGTRMAGQLGGERPADREEIEGESPD